MNRIQRRALCAGLAIITAVGLSSCALPGANNNGGSGSALDVNADGSDWTGTITMFAQAYTPNSSVATSQKLTALRDVADAYEKDHPGVTIQFADEKFDVYTDAVRVKAAAGELWDVFWGQSAALNGSLPKGIAVNLAPALDVKNKYEPDAATWRDAMNPEVIAATTAGDGSVYNINGDYVLTGWYFNKELFAQAGVQVPTTWTEFVQVCQKLKDAGINPVSYVPYYGWMSRHFLSDLYADDYEKISQLDGSAGYSSSDEALAIRAGIFDPSDPKFMSWWPVFKQATDTWQRDYITAPSEDNDRAEQDFFAGKAAMYYSGSWLPSKLDSAAVPFQWDIFPFPQITAADLPGATGADTANVVGGPTGAYQFAMATPQSDKTMQEKGKPEAVLDWMRYLGVGQNNEKIVNEAGQFLPTFAGTKPVAAFEAQADIINTPWRALVVNFTAPNLDVDQQSIFGSYLAGNISIDDAKSQMKALLTKASDDFIKANNLG